MSKIKNLITYQSIHYQETKDISKLLAYDIQRDYKPELMIFVARGGHIVASAMQEVLHVPMIDIDCSMNTAKKTDSIMPYIPEFLKKKLRMYSVLKQNPNKEFNKKIKYSKQQWKLYQNVDKILLVDDMVETGKTIEHVLPIIQDYFEDAQIKVAALSNFGHDSVQYQYYQNTILAGPWGRDSKDYARFVKEYAEYQIVKQKRNNAITKQSLNMGYTGTYRDSNHVLEKNMVKRKIKQPVKKIY